MSDFIAAPIEAAAPQLRSGARRSAWIRLLMNPLGAFSIAILLLIILFGLSAPLFAPWQPGETDLLNANSGPFTPGHLFGADQSGRDIFSRLMWGTNGTVIAALITLVVALVVGLPAGLLAGFYRGRADMILNFLSDVIMSLPGIVLLIALYSLAGPNINLAMAVFGVIIAPNFFRLVRAVVISVRSELYVDAAKVVGLSDLRIVGRHVLWAVRAPVVIQSSFILAGGVGIQGGLDFLGMGDPAQPAWGRILQQTFNNIYTTPAAVLFPALILTLTILALILLGNALRDVLQETSRSKALSPRRRRALIAKAAQDREETATESVAIGSSDDVVLSIRGLRVGYPTGDGVVEVVRGVDLDVRRGEIHGLVGESGSGKSQIAFSTLGILPREALILGGSILLEGVDLLEDKKRLRGVRGRRIAYVPQEPMSNLDPSFTIGAQLVYGLRAARPMSAKEARERLVALLERVGITDPERVMRLYPHEISGGMAQRVLICGAIASDPDVIVADEPTTALDVTVQADVLELLRELSAERGLAMILVTHNLGVVADLCDTVSVMKSGQIVERNDVDELFAAPKQPYTQELLASSRRVELMEA
ncbi:dipeptide/oligopeptide/nickel ABC transporter permease/ATP-binding protein [Arthrobacter burdickii]|uniref:Dipeptide/oligopeptide/nickel ABC transporter permease/ATP-binding protein n=1 Tax=Arthrobacter burdickii TaxID=3035920 RepID=A0ABT8JXF9_9MICC|nr:dipeptide/oligopeptide/nickel ABC transporter permease/ATP-binding protein [Arthrobacter burdickii]MDN4609863.1 dipeptide/oligopeptide/nickel ABC transporter permease/ATP-binding protein [Arthrobacter burdickii]